jgi:hypothetical protein
LNGDASMTRLRPQPPHLTASVVLQKNERMDKVALDARVNEGLTVLAKAIGIFTSHYALDVSYDVEILVQDHSIILKGRVVPAPSSAPKMHLSAEEMQALFEMNN